jgi:hypothetical protein
MRASNVESVAHALLNYSAGKSCRDIGRAVGAKKANGVGEMEVW